MKTLFVNELFKEIYKHVQDFWYTTPDIEETVVIEYFDKTARMDTTFDVKYNLTNWM